MMLQRNIASLPFSALAPTINTLLSFAEHVRLWLSVMSVRKFPVVVETSRGRTSAKVSFSAAAQPVDISLALRESGWNAYRVRFDPEVAAWVAKVIDWGQAA
jgi:hypothetical protein